MTDSTTHQATDAAVDDPTDLTRREALKLSGLTLGGLAVGGPLASLLMGAAQADNICQDCGGDCDTDVGCTWSSTTKAQRYSYFERLPKFYPCVDWTVIPSTIQPLDANAMRITFMGTAVPPRNLAQRMVSIFVEVGWDPLTNQPLDQFVFDCGTGSTGCYNSMNVSYGRMNKIFLTHLHADHTGDLAHIYCFGPSVDRKSPQWVWGAGRSGVVNPRHDGTAANGPATYEDGTADFCANLRDAYRWHTEGFSFQTTAYTDYPDHAPARDQPDHFGWATGPSDKTRPQRPTTPAGQYGDDPLTDAYALMAVELDFAWDEWLPDAHPAPIIAYDNDLTKARITAYPVIHDRRGSIGYKLEWTAPNGDVLSMIFTGDTKPEKLTVEQARNGGAGVDVLIHEMAVPPEIWAMKFMRLNKPEQVPAGVVADTTMVQNSSHTAPGPFGYLLSQIQPYPRLTIATHFPTADDTVECAMKSLKAHLPTVYQGERPNTPRDTPRVTWAMDLMVVTVSKGRIIEQQGAIDPFGYTAWAQPSHGTTNTCDEGVDGWVTPKYHLDAPCPGEAGDPYAQITTATAYCACNPDGTCNYSENGY